MHAAAVSQWWCRGQLSDEVPQALSLSRRSSQRPLRCRETLSCAQGEGTQNPVRVAVRRPSTEHTGRRPPPTCKATSVCATLCTLLRFFASSLLPSPAASSTSATSTSRLPATSYCLTAVVLPRPVVHHRRHSKVLPPHPYRKPLAATSCDLLQPGYTVYAMRATLVDTTSNA
jgi:hypothetical protein